MSTFEAIFVFVLGAAALVGGLALLLFPGPTERRGVSWTGSLLGPLLGPRGALRRLGALPAVQESGLNVYPRAVSAPAALGPDHRERDSVLERLIDLLRVRYGEVTLLPPAVVGPNAPVCAPVTQRLTVRPFSAETPEWTVSIDFYAYDEGQRGLGEAAHLLTPAVSDTFDVVAIFLKASFGPGSLTDTEVRRLADVVSLGDLERSAGALALLREIDFSFTLDERVLAGALDRWSVDITSVAALLRPPPSFAAPVEPRAAATV